MACSGALIRSADQGHHIRRHPQIARIKCSQWSATYLSLPDAYRPVNIAELCATGGRPAETVITCLSYHRLTRLNKCYANTRQEFLGSCRAVDFPSALSPAVPRLHLSPASDRRQSGRPSRRTRMTGDTWHVL